MPGFGSKNAYTQQCCSMNAATQSYAAPNITLITSATVNQSPPPPPPPSSTTSTKSVTTTTSTTTPKPAISTTTLKPAVSTTTLKPATSTTTLKPATTTTTVAPSTVSTTAGVLSPTLIAWIKSTGYFNSTTSLNNVWKVSYSANYVYVYTNSLPSWTPVGPWKNNPNKAIGQNFIAKIIRNPVSAAFKSATSLGPIGVLTNGVVFFNANDGQSYNNYGI